jgi:ribosomal protein S18 acetylase RimI-like enzyme
LIEVVAPQDRADHAAWATERVVADNNDTFGPDDWDRFGLRAVDRDGTVVGGIAGYSHWALGHVDHLWIHPGHRRRGLGSRLLSAAGRLLHERGCRAVILETYSFQDALPFYRHHGFEIVLTTEDHPPGHRRWTLSRPLP